MTARWSDPHPLPGPRSVAAPGTPATSTPRGSTSEGDLVKRHLDRRRSDRQPGSRNDQRVQVEVRKTGRGERSQTTGTDLVVPVAWPLPVRLGW